jgi:hypothetical protein
LALFPGILYFVSFDKGFSLHTSSFYFKPSLTDPNGESFPANFQFKCNAEGFTESFKLVVANSIEGEVTDGDISYSITLNEAGANPLFDLYVDEGEGGKTPCGNNVINSTLEGNWEGDLENSNSHILCFKLKEGAEMPESGSIGLNLVVASSAPYAQSYTFRLSVKAGVGMIQIPGTDIERPDVTIEAGEILVFKGEKYAFIEDVDDLMVPYLKIEDLMEDEDLKSGSLYVPASVGTLVVGSNKYINWDVYGHIILEPDIEVNSYTSVNMLSHAGDVVLNNTKIYGNTANNVNIKADSGSIEANQTQIATSANYGKINLEAKLDINLDLANITSNGAEVNIQSDDGSIDASNATISSTNEGSSIDIQSSGQINVSEATVTCKGSGGLSIISEAEGIDASKATISSTNGGSSIDIQSSGQINVSETMVTCKGSGGLSIISEAEGIDASNANISSTNEGSSIDIQSSGQINVSEATVTCNGDDGVQILSINGDIDASNASIVSTNGARTAAVVLKTPGFINLNGARVESKGSAQPPSPALLIESTADGISAISATLTSTNSDKLLKIAAQGLIDLDEALVSSGGSININTSEDISIQLTSMTGKIESGELLFESTGSNRKLYVDNATLSGHSIKAYGLQIEGTPASGNIQQL